MEKKQFGKFSFINEAKSTRSGFSHTSTLFEKDRCIMRATCHYLNRTWESYSFQTSMQKAVNQKIDCYKRVITGDYREKNNVKRMTKKHVEIVEKLFKKDSKMKEFLSLYKKLQ